MNIVIDASVCLKWLFAEEDSSAALSILKASEEKKVTLLAPLLWEYEIVNALVTAVARDKITFSNSLKFLKFFLKSKPQLLSIADEYKLCLTLAKKYQLSGYDGSYLTLAKAANTALVSADAKLVRKVADTRLVIGLKEYAASTE
ncbi:type II toxin-antitoxin system VapC family toxin [Candidatus Collierbacteria bacterium]|nr:type II toxin-antitoxin system VapC family toxin [Candidatus Collierbacteria bacterium]